MGTRPALILAFVLAAAPLWGQGENMIRNGGFEVDTDNDRMADDWKFQGDQGVTVTWSRDVGVEGRYSQQLFCTAFRELSPASHVMLAQYDTVSLKEGQWYRLSFQVKGERIPGNMASVAISQTGPWENCGLSESFRVRPEWRQLEYPFRATRTISTKVRLQIWFLGTGTIWVDDVRLVPSEPVRARCTEALADLGSKNLVPNSSFECGTSGWGSIAAIPGWGGNLNSLLGEIDATTAARHGASLKIALDRRTAPVYHFDYFEMYRFPVLNPRAGNRGWISVTPGAEYTLSAYVKADPAGTPCVLEVHEAFRGSRTQEVKATADWQRVSFTVKPSADQVFVALGPDLTKSDLPRATLWIDAVQFEKGATATDYQPRASVEIGIEWERPGHLFAEPKDARAVVTAFNAGSDEKTVTVQTTLTDFFDRSSPGPALRLTLPPGRGVRKPTALGVTGKGAYRVALSSPDGAVIPARSERFAVIQPCRDADGFFGMNHAYPWAELNRLSKEIGLTWFRDWSLKWQHVEPEKGRFDFTEADHQIDRVLQERLHLIGLLPFPSSDWSSTAPPDVPKNGYQGRVCRGAYMPRDLSEFANYVRTTVRHYAGRLQVWEIMNEPVYTEYALPRENGYSVADYVKLLEVAYQAVKEADPKAFVIGGIAAGPETLTADFVAAGGLKWVDAINIHTYPGMAYPERYLAGLEGLNAAMEKAGGRKPIWDTEGAYYADDDVPFAPFTWWGTQLETERECAAYQVRLDVILIAAGTRKIIYHSGTPGSLNREDPAGIFFEWDGAPRKMAASQAALTALLGLDTVSLGALSETPRAYGFRSRGKTVVVVWNDGEGDFALTPGREARLLDIVGNEVKERSVALGETPCYLVFEGAPAAERVRGLTAGYVHAAQ